MKLKTKLLLIFQFLDIITTYIGVHFLGSYDKNPLTLFTSIDNFLLIKTGVTLIVAYLMEKLPFETDKTANFLVWVGVSIPIVCAIWNIIVVILLYSMIESYNPILQFQSL